MAPLENLSDKIKITIGKLLRDADVISKKVLTVFDPSKDTDVNIAKLAKLNRQARTVWKTGLLASYKHGLEVSRASSLYLEQRHLAKIATNIINKYRVK